MKRHWCIAAFLLLLGIAGVASTYTRLSQTVDEPWHVSCGMQWWQSGTYTLETLHPPLTRVMMAAPLFLANTIAPLKSPWSRNVYMRELVLTRLGVLPFYIVSCAVVLMWSRKLFGKASALWSLALYISLSSVTAHAGLATTDMGYTSMFMLALFLAVRWLEYPGKFNSVMLGESLGLMVGAKFSSLVQWPEAMALILMARVIANHKQSLPLSPLRREHIITGLIYVLPLSVLMLGLLYRFDFGQFFDGIRSAQKLNAHGFAIWMFRPLYHAVWYFFPVVFFFKTPIPFHFVSLFGAWRTVHDVREGKPVERLYPLLAALAVITVSMTSNINLGVRHVLVMYPLLAIPAGYGMYRLWQGELWKRAAVCGLLLWQVWGYVDVWPDHIAYFNELAGAHPEHIVLDSDFDWSQDEMQLAEVLRKRQVKEIYLCLRQMHVNDRNKILLDAQVKECPAKPVSGWIAVSRTERTGDRHKFAWLDHYEAVQMVGKTLDLYYIPAE